MSPTHSTVLRRSGARNRSARTPAVTSRLASVLAALLLGASLAACGGEEPDSARDPQGSAGRSETPEATPTETPSAGGDAGTDDSRSLAATGTAGVTEVTLLSATEAGGSASTLAFVLDTEQARSDFAGQFEGDFGATVLAELDAQQSAAGSMPYGAVAAVGCDAPESVRIDAGEAGLEVTPQLPKKTVQCLAPMTFVVLFEAPPAA